MNCVDFLSQIPASIQQELEKIYASWLQQGHSLVYCLTNPAVSQVIYQQMKPCEQKTLATILKRVGSQPFTDHDLSRFKPQDLSGAELKIGLLELRRKGIVVTMRKMWGDRVHLIPRDVYENWRKSVMPLHVKSREAKLSAQDIRELELGKHGLAEDLFRFVTYLEKQGALPLTKKKVLSKRHLQQIAAVIQLEDADFAGVEFRYVHQDTYSKAFTVIFDIALRLGLVGQANDRLTLHHKSWEDWLRLDRSTMEQKLHRLWTRIYLPEDIWFQHAADGITELGHDDWASLETIHEWLSELQELQDPTLSHNRLERFEIGWLRPLAALGWLRLGQTVEGKTLFRWKRAPEVVDEIYVQEDFEVIVPPGAPFALRRHLEAFAELTSFDETQVAHYRMARQTIWEACERGYTAKQICELLQSFARYGVPEEVIQAIEEWAAKFGQVSFADVRLLRCEEISIADEIATNPHLSPWIIARIGDLDFIVRQQDHPKLVKHLENSGYAPRKSITEAHPSVVNDQEQELQGIVYPQIQIPLYELDHELPPPEAVYPNIDQIPAIWLQRLQDYHDSTRREIIRQAIEWQAYIRLRQAEREITIIPRQLTENQDRWGVIALDHGRELTCQSDDWQEIQLILPGINDTY